MPAVPGFVGTITCPASTGQQTYTLPTGSGTVKALLLWWTEQTADGSAAQARFSFGMGTYRGGSVQQVFGSLNSQDAQGSAAGAQEFGTDAIAVLQDEGTTTRDGEIDLVSLGSDQFVLDHINIPGTGGSTLLNYVALCGDAFTDALVSTVAIGDATGAQDVTVTAGFGQPDLLLFLSSGSASSNSIDPWGVQAAHISMSLGAGIKDGARRATAFNDDDGSGTMDSGIWQQQGVVLGMSDADSGAENMEFDLNASSGWPTDGFEVNRILQQAATIGYLALKGTFNKALSARTTPTVTGNSDYDVGFSNQKVALCWGGNVTLAAGSTAPDSGGNDGHQFWIGACDSIGNEAYKAFSQDDGNGSSDTASYHSGAKTVQMHDAGGFALLLEADGSLNVGTAFRLAYTTVDPDSRELNALVLGWDAEAAAGFAFPHQPFFQTSNLYNR